MNAAAAQRLEELLRGRNPVRVKSVTIDGFDIVPSLVRKKFEDAKSVEINEHGMGAELSNGTWIWIDGEGGPR